jgi:hypothetical protein
LWVTHARTFLSLYLIGFRDRNVY